MPNEHSSHIPTFDDYVAAYAGIKHMTDIAAKNAPTTPEVKQSRGMLSAFAYEARMHILHNVTEGSPNHDIKGRIAKDFFQSVRVYEKRMLITHAIVPSNPNAYLTFHAQQIFSQIPHNIIEEMTDGTNQDVIDAGQKPELLAARMWLKREILTRPDTRNLLRTHNKARADLYLLGTHDEQQQAKRPSENEPAFTQEELQHTPLLPAEEAMASAAYTRNSLDHIMQRLLKAMPFSDKDKQDIVGHAMHDILAMKDLDEARKVDFDPTIQASSDSGYNWEEKHIDPTRAIVPIIRANLDAFNGVENYYNSYHTLHPPLNMDEDAVDYVHEILEDIYEAQHNDKSTKPKEHAAMRADGLSDMINQHDHTPIDPDKDFLTNAMETLLRGLNPRDLDFILSSDQMAMMHKKDYRSLAHSLYAVHCLDDVQTEVYQQEAHEGDPNPKLPPQIASAWHTLETVSTMLEVIKTRQPNEDISPDVITIMEKELHTLQDKTATVILGHFHIHEEYIKPALEAIRERNQLIVHNAPRTDDNPITFIEQEMTPKLIQTTQRELLRAHRHLEDIGVVTSGTGQTHVDRILARAKGNSPDQPRSVY